MLWASNVGGLAADEEFGPAVQIEAGDRPIDVSGCWGAAACYADFDGDGLNDLLVGQDQPGRLRIYRNKGTQEVAQFDDFEWFRADGEIAELPMTGLFRPQLTDLNGDKKRDVISDSSSGLIVWYRADGGEFAGAEPLRLANGQLLNAGCRGHCRVVDWDGDGDNDLVIAGQLDPDDAATDVRLVENQGAATSLLLAPPRSLEADGQPIQMATEAYPFVADWNADGQPDLLLGLWDGSVLLYENSGDTGAPRLTKARQLIPPNAPGAQPPGQGAPHRGQTSSFCVTDWDGDGRMDLLLGDSQQESLGAALNSVTLLEDARQQAVEMLADYRGLRQLYRRIDPEKREKGKDTVRQLREKDAQRLEEVNAKVFELEKAAQPRQVWHNYVWLMRRAN